MLEWEGEGSMKYRKIAYALICVVAALSMALLGGCAASISDCTITVSDSIYTGSELQPQMTVEVDGKHLVQDTDYTVEWSDNVEVGTATATVTGIGDYSGTASANFQVQPAPIDEACVIVGSSEYDGEQVEPPVRVVVKGQLLEEGTDYTVKYPKSVDVGTATAVVTAKGDNCTGSQKVKYQIRPKSIGDAKVSKIQTQEYAGGPVEPVVEVTSDGEKLEAGTDFTVTYENNDAVGTAKAIVKGAGNYGGQQVVKFKITPRSMAAVEVSEIPAQPFTGGAVEPPVTVIDGDYTLEPEKDYIVVYLSNTDMGEATAIVKGVGNYEGTQTLKFYISEAGDALARAACRVAYSRGVYYGGGTNGAHPATSVWRTVYGSVNPGSRWIRGCVTAVKAIVRWSGYDDTFPTPTRDSSSYYQNYIQSHSSKWQIVGQWDGNTANLRPGDILTLRQGGIIGANGSGHSLIYVGHDIAMEIYEKYLKGTDADMGAPGEDMVFVSSHGAGNVLSNRSSAPCICDGKFGLAYAYGKNAFTIIRPVSGPNLEGSKYRNTCADLRP